MTDSKHTPGPWYVFGTDDGRSVLRVLWDDPAGEEGVCVADLEPTHYRQSANARLIAAAPDLLEAARLAALMLETLEDGTEGFLHPTAPGGECNPYRLLRAAIAKATREEK